MRKEKGVGKQNSERKEGGALASGGRWKERMA